MYRGEHSGHGARRFRCGCVGEHFTPAAGAALALAVSAGDNRADR
jgi:hypothetical protein